MYILLSYSFCLKNWNWFTLICHFAKSIHDLELDFGYVVDTGLCMSCAKNCTKLLKKSVFMIYLVLLSSLPRWILQLNINLFLSPTSSYCLVMMRCTSGEFTMIWSLLEILFPDLCLFLIINVYIKIYKDYNCVCWFPRLVLYQRNSERKFGSRSALFIFICIYLVYGE
jgi:hypothetical protein